LALSCAVIGYGPAFNMGKAHCGWIAETDELELFAVCDIDKKRTKQAKRDFPGIETFNSADELVEEDFDLATVVTPHNTHAPLAVMVLEAGKNCVVEKPMCITVAEADQMISAAKESGVVLSVFHNRRWDGDFLTLKDILKKGLLGEVFQVEAFAGGYGHPGKWWRSEKKVSGGAMYDWGAHFLDWVLNLYPADTIDGVAGFCHDLVWKDVSNEDDVRAIMHFRSGLVADFQLSSIARVGKPKWRILGTKGALVTAGKSFHVTTEIKGLKADLEVPFGESDWPGFYDNIVGHLLRGEELAVKPEEARRVIEVMEAAEKSWKSGKMEKLIHE